MKTLKEYLAYAEQEKKAIAHFNVANSDMLMALVDAALKLSEASGEKIPLVIGVSEGERAAFGELQFVDYITSLRNEHDYPIFSNADHTYSVAATKSALDAGFDMVIYDGNKVSHEENIAAIEEVVNYRNEVNPDCLVEAELGFIGEGSNVKESLPEGVSEATMTDPQEAQSFVRATGVDLLAPSVGNVHGMIKTGNPALDPKRVREVREAAGVPLVLHGGSGSSDEDFLSVIDAGISLIHISTELRVAYKKGIQEAAVGDELAPYKYMKAAKEAVSQVAYTRMKLFWRI